MITYYYTKTVQALRWLTNVGLNNFVDFLSWTFDLVPVIFSLLKMCFLSNTIEWEISYCTNWKLCPAVTCSNLLISSKENQSLSGSVRLCRRRTTSSIRTGSSRPQIPQRQPGTTTRCTSWRSTSDNSWGLLARGAEPSGGSGPCSSCSAWTNKSPD